MAETEVYRIQIPIEIADQTDAGLAAARQKVNAFEQAARRSEARIRRMSQTRYQLAVSALDRATPTLKAIGRSADSLLRTSIRIPIRVLDYATMPLRGLLSLATSTLGLLGIGVGGAAAAQVGIRWPLQLADNLTVAQIGFETLLKSKTAAAGFMKDLQKFAIATPFGQQDVIENAKFMMGFGFKREQIIPGMTAIGDAVSLLGGGSEAINGIVRALGQMRLKGKVSAEEMQQLSERQIPAWELLAAGIGKTTAQTMQLAQAGKITADRAVPLILQEMERKYKDGMAKTGSMTVGGLFSQIQDTLTTSVFSRWGQGLQSVLVPKLKAVNAWLGSNEDLVARLGTAFERAGTTVGQFAVDKLGWLQSSLTKLTKSDAWKAATSLGAKIKLAWDKIIKEPFDTWWSSKSTQQWLTDKAYALGGTLGSSINAGIMALLGKDPAASPFASTGERVGAAFGQGFLKGLNPSEITAALGNAIVRAQPKAVGGQSDSLLQSAISDAAMGFGAFWLLSKIPGAKLLATKVLPWLFRTGSGVVGRSAITAAPSAAALAAGAASAALGSGVAAAGIPIFGPHGEILRTVGTAATPAIASAASGTGLLGPLAALIGPIVAGIAFHEATKNLSLDDPSLLNTIRVSGLSIFAPGVLDLMRKYGSNVSGNPSAIATTSWPGQAIVSTVDKLTDGFSALDRVVRDLTAHLRQWGPSSGGMGPQLGIIPSMANPPGATIEPTIARPPAAAMATPSEYIAMAQAAARKYGLDPELFVRQIRQESGFNPRALSPAGAQGIAQFMPATARGMGIDPWDPAQALPAAAQYMSERVRAYGGDYSLALAAYVAGAGNVQTYGQRIFDPAYLMSQGWASESAYQPLNYRRAVLGFANGGTLYEPIVGLGVHSGRSYAFGERGAEDVIPRGSARGGQTINIADGAIRINLSEVNDPQRIAAHIADAVAGEISRRLRQSRENLAWGGL